MLFISVAQCRAARALLGWSQDDLATRSNVSKKTVADFERGVRHPHPRTRATLSTVFDEAGVALLPARDKGEGVCFKRAKPTLLFRRNDVPHRKWVAFAFDFRGERWTGFIRHDALNGIADGLAPTDAFDIEVEEILACAIHKVDAHDLDPEGRVLIKSDDR